MLKKDDVEKIEKLRKEKNNLEERIKKLESKPRKFLADGVKESSKYFPYTQHTFKIQGYDNSVSFRKRKNSIKKLKKMLSYNKQKIEKEIVHIEYELNYVEDPEIRELIRMRYEEGLNWVQIQLRQKYKSEDVARKKIERFFKKI